MVEGHSHVALDYLCSCLFAITKQMGIDHSEPPESYSEEWLSDLSQIEYEEMKGLGEEQEEFEIPDEFINEFGVIV